MATGTIQKNMVLLWENPNPNQALANNPITFDTGFPLYLLIFKREATRQAVSSVCFYNGTSVTCIDGAGYYNKVAQRDYNWTDGVGLTPQSGYYADHTATTNICIALKIYGIKA